MSPAKIIAKSKGSCKAPCPSSRTLPAIKTDYRPVIAADARRQVSFVADKSAKLLKRRMVPLTAALCRRVLEATKYKKDRKPAETDIAAMMQSMKRGDFNWDVVTLAFCRFEEKEYRINGQHSCWAFYTLLADPEFASRTPPKITLLEYSADDNDQLNRLWGVQDRGRPRTATTVGMAYLGDTKQFGELSRREVLLLTGGLSTWLWTGSRERRRRSPEDITHLLKTKYKLPANMTLGWLRQAGANHTLTRTQIAAAMLATANASQEGAELFWRAVIKPLQLEDANDPRLTLGDYLRRIPSAAGISSQVLGSDRTNRRQRFLYLACIYAWNMFCAGEPISHIPVKRLAKLEDIEPAVYDAKKRLAAL